MGESLLSTPVFAVQRRRYRRPDHGMVERDIVVHPGAVLILPLLSDGRIVMIRNYRHAVEEELWELPAGTLEPGEQPRDCAARELEEETGYRAAELEPLMEFFTTPGFCNERIDVFVARNLTETRQRLQGVEEIRVAVLEVAEVRSMMLAGALRDAKTLAVLGAYFLSEAA